jgi:CRISPR system Cascade subunit CasD
MRDYQTATGVLNAAGKVELDRTVVSPRFYLSDAVFLVGLEGDHSLLGRIHVALRHPLWPLALGRKSFVPSLPVYLPDAVVEQDLETALKRWPYLSGNAVFPKKLRLVLEDKNEGSVRLDEPVAPFSERRFGPRFIKTVMMQLEDGHVPDPLAA